MEQTRENGRNEAENESTARMQNPQQQQSTQNNTGMARAWNVAVRIGGYPGPGAQGFGNINVNTMQYQPGDCFRAVGLRNYSGPDAQRNGNNNPNPMQFQQRQQSTQNTTEMARARHGGDIGTAQRLAHVNARLITPGQQLRTHSVAANGPEALLGGNLGAATGNRQGSLGASK